MLPNQKKPPKPSKAMRDYYAAEAERLKYRSKHASAPCKASKLANSLGAQGHRAESPPITEDKIRIGKLRRKIEFLDDAAALGEELMEVWDD